MNIVCIYVAVSMSVDNVTNSKSTFPAYDMHTVPHKFNGTLRIALSLFS